MDLVKRRQLDAEGDLRVQFPQCKRGKVLWSQIIRGFDAICWDSEVGGVQQDLVTNFELVFTSSPVRLLLLVILGAPQWALCEGERRCLIREESINSGD